MKFGVTLKESGGDPAGQARKAEDLGFDSVWAGEHVVWRHPIQDSLMQMAAAAAVTERIELGTAIVLIPLKHPILMCKAVTTLDHLSGGRVKFGIGIGGEYTKEFEAMGVPVNERGPRANEIMRLMKRLWTEESVTFSGAVLSTGRRGAETATGAETPPADLCRRSEEVGAKDCIVWGWVDSLHVLTRSCSRRDGSRLWRLPRVRAGTRRR